VTFSVLLEPTSLGSSNEKIMFPLESLLLQSGYGKMWNSEPIYVSASNLVVPTN